MKNILGLFFTLIMIVSCADSHKNELKKQLKQTNPEQASMQQENVTPDYLYKLVSEKDWELSQAQNHVVNSPIDKDFIHLSTKEQLPHVAKKFWSNQTYIILKLNSKKLIGRLVFEVNPGGTTPYYHLYEGTIPLDAIVEFTINLN